MLKAKRGGAIQERPVQRGISLSTGKLRGARQ